MVLAWETAKLERAAREHRAAFQDPRYFMAEAEGAAASTDLMQPADPEEVGQAVSIIAHKPPVALQTPAEVGEEESTWEAAEALAS